MNTSSVPSSAYQVGYVIGIIVATLAFLAVLGVAVYAIVQAFRKKTRGWIMGGILGGLFLLIPAGLMTAGMVKGFLRGYQEAVARHSVGSEPKSIQGLNLRYVIEAPSGWTIRRQVQAFDLMMNRGSLYLGVIAEEANLGSSEVIAEIARARIQENGANIEWSDPQPLVLDGRNWLRFTVNCTVKKVPLSYQFYTYAGEEGTFQIIGWTAQSLAEKYRAEMTRVMQTFRFPATNSAAL